ncbi:hypothetical protein P5673_026606, partial [Acropora cervicornis]
SPERVNGNLSHLNKHKAPGPDGLSNCCLKEHAELLYQPIADIFNSSYKEQKLLSVWKHADVTPLPKVKQVVDPKNELRRILLTASLYKGKDNRKIKFRELHETTYTALWRSLLRIGKVDEALFAAEQGRAQTLSDNLLIQFKLPASLSPATFDTEGTISRLSKEIITSTIFLAIEGLTINTWFLSRENKVVFRQGRLEGDRREEDPIHALLQSS